ncbi:g-patch domain protein [Dictyocaulus viviparus]|uniref:G-patch domain protein n=1 Tax=Dictyocaulus viviparus TaxID=29172 RepID=A0A0D8XIY7_DICVI|nr:g-patch domain protein [Dictyocaulus viviparus]
MVEEEDGMEAFDFDDRDLEFALNPGRRHYQTKNQATYGGSREVEKDNEPIELTYKKERKKQTSVGANVFAGIRSSATREAVDPNVFGDWTKFGKGSVVKNMMKAMGYKEGEGLGISRQGIVEPVQATVRKGRGALGAYGKETVKTRYKTLDEVIEEGGSIGFLSSVKTGVKVIDMTGPEQRVYSGYDSFSLKSRSNFNDVNDRDVFDVPELMYNLNLLVDLTEESIRRNDSQLKSVKDRTTALEYERTQAKAVLESEERDSRRIMEVYELIDKISRRSSCSSSGVFFMLLSCFIMNEIFKKLDVLFFKEFMAQIVEYFSKWRPLDPDHLIYGVDLMKEWRDILVDTEKASMFVDRLSAYDRLLWEGWLPSLRRASLDWDPRDQMEPMLRIIEIWLPVLPSWMKENILEQVIVPRIDDRVSSWDPLTDNVPIHSWLVPWLAVLGDRLQPVLAPIRQKLAKALRMWNPTDHSAMAILKPWRGVWAPATMSAFLAQNVVPKLEKCLDTMNLNPRENKKYEEWYACMSWIGMISADVITSVVTKYFFPRDFINLSRFLTRLSTVIQEVSEMDLPSTVIIVSAVILFKHPLYSENLRRGMVALMESSQGLRVYSAPSQGTLTQPAPPPPPLTAAMRVNTAIPMTSSHMSLKEMLERMAAQHDLTHIPQRDRLKDGRQVYWFGTQSIYLDRNIVYLMDTQSFSWRPVGMEELLQLAGVS